MTDKVKLGDFDMEPNYIGDDLVWGFKAFREAPGGVPHYVLEIVYRLEGVEEPVSVREKRVGDPRGATTAAEMSVLPSMLNRLLPLLTDESYRREVYDRFISTQAA